MNFKGINFLCYLNRAPREYLWRPRNSRYTFGGQVVGQALVAACNTVSADHHVHSLHCYFLRGGMYMIYVFVAFAEDNATMISLWYFENHVSYLV